MCGRVIQSSGPLRLAIVEGLNISDSRMGNVPTRYNAAPSQELLVIRQNHKTGERSLDLIKWGLIPHGAKIRTVVADQSTPRPRASQGFRCSRMPISSALHCSGGWLLRVESHQRRSKATLRRRDEGSLTFRFGWTVGELEEPKHRRVGANIRDYHSAFK
jgi:hypothetical protein